MAGYLLRIEYEGSFVPTWLGVENSVYTAEFDTFTDKAMLDSLNDWLKKVSHTQVDQSCFEMHILSRAISSMSDHNGRQYGHSKWGYANGDDISIYLEGKHEV